MLYGTMISVRSANINYFTVSVCDSQWSLPHILRCTFEVSCFRNVCISNIYPSNEEQTNSIYCGINCAFLHLTRYSNYYCTVLFYSMFHISLSQRMRQFLLEWCSIFDSIHILLFLLHFALLPHSPQGQRQSSLSTFQ